MRALLVEDDPNKAAQISAFLEQLEPKIQIVTAQAYRTGLKAALTQMFDVLCVDMTLPTYEPSAQEPGGRIRAYGGKHLIADLKRRRRAARVIVITQFETFGEGDDAMTLEQLKNQLSAEFPNHYVGTVFYQAAASTWRQELETLLKVIPRE